MRIIAGTWRSRRLVRPATTATRPIPDRVKKSLFDVLGSYYGCPGSLPPLRVLDAFAGSGALGLEALSRGAVECRMVERDRTALAALRKNIDALRAHECAIVVVQDGWAQLEATPHGQAIDLILLDPPYADSRDASESGRVRTALRRLAGGAGRGPVVVLHHEAKVRYALPPDDPWRIVDRRTSGSNGLTIFNR